jgi:hypothetical protein
MGLVLGLCRCLDVFGWSPKELIRDGGATLERHWSGTYASQGSDDARRQWTKEKKTVAGAMRKRLWLEQHMSNIMLDGSRRQERLLLERH